MNIDIYATGLQAGPKNNKQAGCAIILLATDNKNRTIKRAMTFPLKNSTTNLAALQAARLGLLALRPYLAKREYSISLHVDNPYVIDMIEKLPPSPGSDQVYRASPKTNNEVVTALRTLYELFNTVSVGYRKFDSGIGNECRILANGAAMTQTATDSGTRELTPEQATQARSDNVETRSE